eukprot:Sspe_Gene.64377::Locus_37975_Transcript_5_6_Confidence_0.273_Length_1993::g.64377::m.64377
MYNTVLRAVPSRSIPQHATVSSTLCLVHTVYPHSIKRSDGGEKEAALLTSSLGKKARRDQKEVISEYPIVCVFTACQKYSRHAVKHSTMIPDPYIAVSLKNSAWLIPSALPS